MFRLPALLSFGIATAITADGAAGWCMEVPCSTVDNKMPSVALPFGHSVEKALSDDDKVAFEYYLGQAMMRTPAVESATREFALRLHNLIVGMGRDVLGMTDEDALLAAVGSGNVHLTGFPGNDTGLLRAVLTDWSASRTCNFRNVWSTVYVFFNSDEFKQAFEEVPVDYLANTLGFGPHSLVAMEERRWLVQQTKTLPNDYSAQGRPAQGVPDYYWPPLDSWVRFSFPVPGRWGGARKGKHPAAEVSWMSDDASIQPPLSPDEVLYQCGDAGPCKLKWVTGDRRFFVGEEPLGPHPGLRARADAAGYRTVAGASGTTANVMQLAKLLGFRGEDLVALRAAAMAFMLPLRHHSFLEVMLGAEHFMPAGFGMALGREDLGQLWPQDISTSWGETFAASDAWRAVGEVFKEEAAATLVSKMDDDSAAYFLRLLPQDSREKAASLPSLLAV